jgi:hypothetical protein
MYVDALRELAVWFHAMDHTDYARWIYVHMRDMVELPTTHPEIADEFQNWEFYRPEDKQAFLCHPRR